MTTAPVVGFDLGFLNSCVAVARGGGVETVTNEYSERRTPSCISFTDATRLLGNDAKQRIITDMSNTIHGFTKFIGKSYADPTVQSELPYAPYKLVELDDESVGVGVSYLGSQRVFRSEQLVAMTLTKLKSVAECQTGQRVSDCVLNVPAYYDDRERRALLDASRIAGLNCLRLLNDTTAAALTFGICRRDLPAKGEKSRIVAFVDMGHSHLQSCAVAFNECGMRVLATACDSSLGGRDFDRVLFNYFVQEFADNFNIDVRSSQKAQLKLMKECNRVKEQMSANSTEIPVSVECLVGDRDANGSICRAKFFELLESAELLKRIEDCLRLCLSRANLQAGDVASVEILGGSTRVPAVKDVVAKVFNRRPDTTLNADEAVARGCALMCATLSPACRVREFLVADAQPYSVSLCRERDEADKSDVGVVVLPLGCEFPCEREVELPLANQSMPMRLTVRYTRPHEVPHTDRILYRCVIGNREAEEAYEDEKEKEEARVVRLRARVNSHGIFSVAPDALLLLKSDATVSDGESATEATEARKRRRQAGEKRLTVEGSPAWQLARDRLLTCQSEESQMKLDESVELARSSARNSLEEFVYSARSRLLDARLVEFLDSDRSVELSRRLDSAESWLYGCEAEEAKEADFVERLRRLRDSTESELATAEAAAELSMATRAVGESLAAWRNGEGELAGLDQAGAARLSAKAEAARRALAASWTSTAKELLELLRELEEAMAKARARAKAQNAGNGSCVAMETE